MTNDAKLGFNTQQIYAGNAPDPATGARNTPIYQSTAFEFYDSGNAANLFALKEVGFIYSRLKEALRLALNT